MGYLAPVNTLDVSNSNTPGVFDSTNPVPSSYYRAIAQVDANGAIQITENNAYSGNNGRAAILSNGFYYMVGNSNNGANTDANVVAAAGAQIATPSGVALTDPAAKSVSRQSGRGREFLGPADQSAYRQGLRLESGQGW